MTDKTITQLTALAGSDLTQNDEFVIVDSETNTTKKISYGVLEKELQRNNVLRYGADATGATDSTTAFQNCLTENDVIYVPAGTFMVRDLVLNSKTMQGIGTIVRGSGVNYAVIMLGVNPKIDGLTFSTMASAINGESEIQLGDGCDGPLIQECKFTGTLYACVSADANGSTDASLNFANPVQGFVFQKNKVEGGYSRHLYLHSVENMRILNNSFKGSKRDCIRLRQATRKVLVSHNTFDDIGEEFPSIIERPQNWISLNSYTLGEQVSVPPFGIFTCIVPTSTIGANPATTGASEWNNIAPGYFETRDVVDGFWSTVEFIFTSNVINKVAAYGLDLKGSEPNGAYVSQKMIIADNLFQNCFISGINLFFGEFLLDSSFRYVSQILVNNNIFTGCNRERFDVAEGAIRVRGGIRGLSITNNIFEKNYARAINIANFDGAGINRDFIITGNQIYSNGIPGNPSAIGINAGAVDGMIIKNNIIKNLDLIEEYELNVSGTATANGSITYFSIGSAGGSIVFNYSNGDTAGTVISNFVDQLLTDSAFNVTYDTTPGSRYYTNIREDLGTQAFAVDTTGQLRFVSKLPGASGNGFNVVIDEQGTAVNLFPQPSNFIYDAMTQTLTIETRSTTRPFHLIAAFNSNASATIKSLFSIELEGATSSDVLSQSNLVDDSMTLAGGISSNKCFFDARLENQLTPGVTTQDGLTFTLSRNPLASNSVQQRAMNLSSWNQVGSTLYLTPKFAYIIESNFVSGNIAEDRFSVLLNNVEIPALFAYVDSTNINSTTVITPQSHTRFSGGADSSPTNQINSQAFLIFQGITLRARLFGSQGNKLGLRIDQQTDPSQPLRVIVAPNFVGGKEIWIRLPTDAGSNPVDVTVSELEDFLKQRLGESLLSYENNYINTVRAGKEMITGPEDLSAFESAISTTQDVEVFRGTADQLSVGAEILNINQDILDIQGNLPLTGLDGFEIFEHWVSNVAAGNNNWTSTANSGVVGMNISLSTGKEFGIARLDTSTSSTSAPTLNLGSAMWLFSALSNVSARFWLNVGTLSSVAEEYIDRHGLHNSTTSAAPTNGIYFEYDRLNHGVNWQFVTVAASTVTRTDTGIAAIALFREFEIQTTGNTEARAYIGGVLVATHTTNIPSGTGQTVSPTFQKVKTAGTTARITYIDWFRARVTY